MVIGLGLILVLKYRPQGFASEYRLKSKSLISSTASNSK